MSTNSRPNVLLLVHRVPYPPNRGDRIRSYRLLKHLSQSANVHLATLTEEPLEPNTTSALQALCAQVAIEPLGRGRWLNAANSLASGGSLTEGLFESRSLCQTLRHWSRVTRFDAVIAFCSSMAPYLATPGLEGVPAIVDLVDVDSQKFFDYAATAAAPKRWLYQLEGHRLRRVECAIARRAQAVAVISQAEDDLYQGFCPSDRTFVATNGVDLEYFSPRSSPPCPDRCVFVGALDYKPNADGIVWFCREVWPQILARRPGATLDIVGRKPVAAVQQLAQLPGVRVAGSVPDVRPYLASAALAVVPLQIARGVQNKVLEAMAMGIPVVASPQALEGIAVVPGIHAARARTADQWSDRVQELLSDPATRQRMSSAALDYVRSNHDWASCLEPFDICLRRFIPNWGNSDTSYQHSLAPSPVAA